MKKLKKSEVVIVVHIFCWMILASGLLLSHPPDWGNSLPIIFWVKQLFFLLLLIFVFYLNIFLLIPRYLVQKNVWIYVAIVIPIACLITSVNRLVDNIFHLNSDIIVFDTGHHPHTFPGYRNGNWDILVFGMILLMIGLGITISFIQKWNDEVQLRQQLEQEKVSAELSNLKAQINPHFFFNTLNNIYSYTLSDGEIAREAITSLAKMMRYVLYDTIDDKTPLSKEIAFIAEYTALMKLRISEKTIITVFLPEQIKEAMIAPMLLLPFVENAFKHGISSLFDGHIYISICQVDDGIHLIVKNSIYNTRLRSEEASSGIGIGNTKKRLSLLYPGKFELTSGKLSETEYETRLKLIL